MKTLAAASLLLILASAAHAQHDQLVPAPKAAELAREGAFLPTTIASRVSQNHVTALGLGGYDGAPLQGALLSALVEGGLYHRVALRVGTERVATPNGGKASPTVGVRVALLDQRRFGVNLGAVAQYKNTGFTEVNGELELLLTVAHVWGRLAGFANGAFGTGVKDSNERDAEARVAVLWALDSHTNVGLDLRGRFDLGHETPARQAAKIEADFDLLGGPLVSYAMGPTLLLAQGGVHSYLSHEKLQTGVAIIGGLGATF